MKTFLMLTILCLGFLSQPVAAQNMIGVQFNIAGDSGLESQVRSYFAREFREIGDVAITDEHVLLTVNIVIIKVHNRAGDNIGYAMSLAITDSMPIFYLGAAGAAAATDPEMKKQITQSIPKGGILVDHLLRTFDMESLPQSCKELAAQMQSQQGAVPPAQPAPAPVGGM